MCRCVCACSENTAKLCRALNISQIIWLQISLSRCLAAQWPQCVFLWKKTKLIDFISISMDKRRSFNHISCILTTRHCEEQPCSVEPIRRTDSPLSVENIILWVITSVNIHTVKIYTHGHKLRRLKFPEINWLEKTPVHYSAHIH